MSSFFVNTISRLLSLVARLDLGYNSADLDLLEVGGKFVVKRKRVVYIDITAGRVLL